MQNQTKSAPFRVLESEELAAICGGGPKGFKSLLKPFSFTPLDAILHTTEMGRAMADEIPSAVAKRQADHKAEVAAFKAANPNFAKSNPFAPTCTLVSDLTHRMATHACHPEMSAGK